MLNLTTRDLSFKEDFNRNQTGMQDEKWPFKLSRLEILEQGSILKSKYGKIFETEPQGSILGSKYGKIFETEPQGSILHSTRIDSYKKKNFGRMFL